MQIKFTNYIILLCCIAAQLFNAIEAGKYLTERPTFLKSCDLDDSNFNKCFGGNFEGLFTQWKEGVPGLKSVGPIDPLYIKRIKFAQAGGANNAIDLNVDMKDVYVKGASQVAINDASYDRAKHSAKFLVSAPTLRFDFDYKVKGRVLALNLNSQGKGHFVADNVLMDFLIKLMLRNEDEHIFTDVGGMQVDIKSIGGFKLQLDNLFGGNEELEKNAHIILNDNWREIFEILRPAIKQTIETVLVDRFKKTFAYVPANYFIENIVA